MSHATDAVPDADREGRPGTDGAHRRTSRWRWALPAALVVVWLAVGLLGGPYAGKLAEVADNDNAAFLPASAESTQVLDLQERFVERQTLPAIVVWEATDGISDGVRAEVTRQVEALAALDGVVGEVGPALPSQDGQALTAVVPLDADLGEGVIASTDQIREVVSGTPGARAYVTGPASVLGDLETAFNGIDGILLGVALSGVLVILLCVYRSPVLPLIVLFSSVLALVTASLVVYWLARSEVITLNGQSQGILSILVVGAATDYALLLVARFREELREESSRFTAMRIAWRQSAAPVAASGTTVILGVLCLLFSDLNSNRSLGPVAAIGIAGALAVALTFLPAVLALVGRAAFWPFRPTYGSPHQEEKGIWGKVSRLVGRRPRRVWIGVTVVLAAFAAFAPSLQASGVSQLDLFLQDTQSKQGQAALSRHFPGGSGTPVVVVGAREDLGEMLAVAEAADGVAAATPLTELPGGQGEPVVVDGLSQVQVTLSDAADSDSGLDAVRSLREDLDVVGQDVLVGGQSALQLDTNEISERDRTVIIPIVLVVILLVLIVLLRSVVAPLLLVATVVLSFAATLGVAALVFDGLFDWPGSDPSTPLFGFVFLVALGIDYNIFLMTRVREESIRGGTRPGILRGLSVTGGVITSAGLVLAATFAALAVIPILFLAQIAFIVAFGVLLDTFVVRSLLVPALAYDIGRLIWWPSRLARADPGPSAAQVRRAAGVD